MEYLVLVLGLCLITGLIGVAANPAPYFGVIGLVVGVVGGCGLLVSLGGSFVGLILFLIYLGGMLVVFAYSVALAADPCPDAWVDSGVVGNVLVYAGFVCVVGVLLGVVWVVGAGGGVVGFSGFRGEVGGIVVLFLEGGKVLLLCVLALMMALFVVLELVRGQERGSLRVP